MNSQKVFVLDMEKQPLMPCHPARARELLKQGKAAVWRRFPFTIILKERQGGEVQDVQVKVDPGSKVTGVALVGQFKFGPKVLWGAELAHRGAAIKKELEKRAGYRRRRRSANLRYRPARFKNRTKPQGWLPPSLVHRVQTTESWVSRLSRWTPANAISMELVRFDTQKMENPEISGSEYQQGTLWGYEVKGYLLQKWGHQCAYCGAKDVPLEIEHIVPRSKGGSDRVSNLTVACRPCNQRKGARPIEEFLKKKPEVLRRIKAQAKAPLKDAAAVNATRWKLLGTLKAFGFPVEVGTGGRTKYNRVRQDLPKAHWVDAACVGESGENLRVPELQPLAVKSMGRGSRKMCTTNAAGFPIAHRQRSKVRFGFQTGDMVRAEVPKGKRQGVHVGRMTIDARGAVDILTDAGKQRSINHKYCRRLQRHDGYAYTFGETLKRRCSVPLRVQEAQAAD